jgi:histidinol phosphatase-like PHP family hydrolase
MSDRARTDFHVHTKYLGCANETMEVPAIIEECERLGVSCLGIADHLNSLDKLDLHRSIRQDLLAAESALDLYFGVELNFCEQDGEFAFNAEVKEQLGFQYAIGGIHGTYLDEFDPRKIVEIQHRHHLKTCRDPLVDVLVHPYWFAPGEFKRKGWELFDSMEVVPESYARELGQVARETGTAIEINAAANLVNPRYSERYRAEYVDYLAVVAAEGSMFSIGSDAHNIKQLETVTSAWDVAEQLGLTPERIWMPDCEPLVPARG